MLADPARPTAYLAARRAAEVAVKLFGTADPATEYRVRVANQSYAVPGSRLIGPTIGPFVVPAARVVALTVEPVSPGARSSPLAVGRVLGAPVGTVLASIDQVGREVKVLVTNFARPLRHTG